MHSSATQLVRGAEFRAPSLRDGMAKDGIPLD
jgi:hypothetical protein